MINQARQIRHDKHWRVFRNNPRSPVQRYATLAGVFQTLGVGSAASTAEGHTHLRVRQHGREPVRKKVFGLTQIGDPSDGAFDRTTGEGFVAA